MLLYFGGHTISADRPKLNGTIELHQDEESIEVNLEMFFLFVSVKVLPTCTGIVAVIKPPVTWEKFDLPGWQILSCYRAKIERERQMTTLNSYFLVSNFNCGYLKVHASLI